MAQGYNFGLGYVWRNHFIFMCRLTGIILETPCMVYYILGVQAIKNYLGIGDHGF